MKPGSTHQDAPHTRSQQAYRALEELIVTLQLAPGSRISELSMSQQLGLGRTPVREAMQRLAREGSLTILPRAGAIVSEVEITDQFKLIEVRRELERVVIARAARLADASTREKFKALAVRFKRAAETNDEAVFIAADRDFNALTLIAADNKYAEMAMGPIQAQTRRFWFLSFNKFGDLEKVSSAHERIASAIAVNDEAESRKAFDMLIDYVEEYTMRTLKAFL